MTNREFFTAAAAGEMTAEMKEFATAWLAKNEAAREARKGKVTKKVAEKRAANEQLVHLIVNELLEYEAQTATDIAAKLGELTGDTFSVQKASVLCRQAVEMGLATSMDVKIPKKGTQKGYALVA